MKASRYSLRAGSPRALWRRGQSALSHRRTPREPRESLLAGHSRYNLLFVTMCKVVLLILRYIRRFLVCKSRRKRKKRGNILQAQCWQAHWKCLHAYSGYIFKLLAHGDRLPCMPLHPLRVSTWILPHFVWTMTLPSRHRLHIRSLWTFLCYPRL